MSGLDSGAVAIFGAAGPVGAAIAEALAPHYTLRLIDLSPLEEVLGRYDADSRWPQWRQAPPEPHTWLQADVTDPEQVRQAMAGTDAVINLTVHRSQPERAFRVNSVGTYNLLRAAAEIRPKRLIQTGMLLAWGYGYEGDMRYDFRIPEDMPLHPGSQLYGLSKQLGHEMATVFARREGLDILTILFHRLRPHDAFDGRDADVVIPYSTAFDDLGPAMLCALRAETMPRPNEVFWICSEMPMGKFSPDKARRLLGWSPKHNFEDFYRRSRRGTQAEHWRQG
jgi:nucleoside-diphosphate-sugar epimerase